MNNRNFTTILWTTLNIFFLRFVQSKGNSVQYKLTQINGRTMRDTNDPFIVLLPLSRCLSASLDWLELRAFDIGSIWSDDELVLVGDDATIVGFVTGSDAAAMLFVAASFAIAANVVRGAKLLGD